MYSTSVVESATICYLELFQQTTSSFKQNMNSDYDLKSLWSNLKLASVNPFTVSSHCPYTNSISLVILKYLRMFFTAIQCLSLGLGWYLLHMLKAYATLGLIHNMAYMIEPMDEAYGARLILSLSFCVFGHIALERCIPCDMGMFSLLESSILNFFNTLSMYVFSESSSNLLDLFLYILIPEYNLLLPNLSWRNFLKAIFSLIATWEHHSLWAIYRPHRGLKTPLRSH